MGKVKRTWLSRDRHQQPFGCSNGLTGLPQDVRPLHFVRPGASHQRGDPGPLASILKPRCLCGGDTIGVLLTRRVQTDLVPCMCLRDECVRHRCWTRMVGKRRVDYQTCGDCLGGLASVAYGLWEGGEGVGGVEGGGNVVKEAGGGPFF